jgi:hypothetical protein
VQHPLHLSCKSYDGPDQSVSGHMSECLFIVNAFLLGKSTSDNSFFILLNTSISSMFYFEEPSVGYPIFILRSGNYFPYFVSSLWISIPLSWHLPIFLLMASSKQVSSSSRRSHIKVVKLENGFGLFTYLIVPSGTPYFSLHLE